LLLFALEGLLSSPDHYAQVQAVLAHPLSKVGFILALWLFLHHLLAGIRFLGLDLHYAIEIQQARLTSKLVLGAGMLLTLLISITTW
jgi:succinate dehydrogenase / fumarate reductase cytochrome b subunit